MHSYLAKTKADIREILEKEFNKKAVPDSDVIGIITKFYETDNTISYHDGLVSAIKEFYREGFNMKNTFLFDLQKMCRSDDKGFTITDRLDVIKEVATRTGKYTLNQMPFAHVYTRSDVDLSGRDDIILISSHVDTVPSIDECFCEKAKALTLSGTSEFLRGTFDNTATNAALLSAMMYGALPENVVIAFTGDEETGRCNGAKDALICLGKQNIFPCAAFALDVTYMGKTHSHGNDKTYTCITFENNFGLTEDLMKSWLNAPDKDFLIQVEPKGAKDTKKALVGFDRKNISVEPAWFDEGAFYKKAKIPFGGSICLPVYSSGQKYSMHSPYGVYMFPDVYERYIENLTHVVKETALTLAKVREAEKDEVER